MSEVWNKSALRVVAFWLGAASLLAVGCGGGSSGGGGGTTPDPIAAAFAGSGTARTANLVRMTGQAATSDRVRVDVVIGGPTTSSDIYSFAFDIIIGNTAIAEYVGASASAGDALTTSGGQSIQTLVSQEGNRVVVGVTKSGGGAGNGIADAEPTVVSLVFRIKAKGVSTLTFDGSPTNPQHISAEPSALDSVGNRIDSITFDGSSARISG